MISEENSDLEIESGESDDSSEDSCEEYTLTPEKSTCTNQWVTSAATGHPWNIVWEATLTSAIRKQNKELWRKLWRQLIKF